MTDHKITYVNLDVAKGKKRQRMKPEGSSVTEQEIIYAELNLHSAMEHLQRKDKRCQSKGLSPSSEKLLARILGIICLILLSMVVSVTIIIFNAPMEQNNYSSTNRSQEAYFCGCCPSEWFKYSHNCYHFGNTTKTWNQSVTACASKNSSLLYFDNEEEKEFLKSMSVLSWIGIFRESNLHPWMLLDGSMSKLQLREESSGFHCIVLHSTGLVTETCNFTNTYYCKYRLWN